MKVLGIITEYNPFHNGHLYHLNEAKEKAQADYTICIMSGHFLQRGIPSLMDKWTRSKNALASGVDLIIELPVIYSLSSAEYFAEGATKLLESINLVDTLVFGSEKGSVQDILKMAKVYADEPKDYVRQLKNELNKGLSFPRARENAFKTYMNDATFVSSDPNNILGIEYAKALHQIKSKIKIETIKRINNDYHDSKLTGRISSATAIRKTIKNVDHLSTIQDAVPKSTFNSLLENRNDLVFKEHFSQIILYKLRSMSLRDLSHIHDVSEGLENRIKTMANEVDTLKELLDAVKTKRYAYTRIQRIVFKALLNIEKDDITRDPQYIRVLGFNKKGQQLLRQMQEEASLPIVTNLKHFNPANKQAQRMMALDLLATDIYQLLRHKKTGNLDYLKPPVIL